MKHAHLNLSRCPHFMKLEFRITYGLREPSGCIRKGRITVMAGKWAEAQLIGREQVRRMEGREPEWVSAALIG